MKLGTIEHPTTAALARELGVTHLTAVGLLEALWHFTARYARRGDVGRFVNRDIAEGIRWPDDPDRMVAALVATRWLDLDSAHRLIVHDWHEHAEAWVQGALKRGGVDFVTPNGPEVAPPGTSGSGEKNLRLLKEGALAVRPGTLKGQDRQGQEEEGTGGKPTAGDRWEAQPQIAAAWAAVPRAEQKGPHRFATAFIAAVQERGADPARIAAQLAAYYASPDGKGGYRWAAHTFIADGHYDDPPEAWQGEREKAQQAERTRKFKIRA